MNTDDRDEDLTPGEQELKRLAEKADMPVLLTCVNGMIGLANEHAASLLGYSLDELYEVPAIELFHPEERGVILDRIKRFSAREIQFPAFSTQLLTKHGEAVPVQFIGLPEKWRGQRSFLNFIRDETLEQKLEDEIQATQRLQSVGTLAGGVAHDFNNLLMSISGNVSLMLYDIDKSHPHYKPLIEIEEQVRSGARLANELLGYAREGKHDEKIVDLRELVENTSKTWGRTRKDITVHLPSADGNDYTIMADRDGMERVLLNLCINAGDAMLNGGELFFTLEHTDRPGKNLKTTEANGQYVHLAVSDTGKGMDEDTLHHAFEPFFTTKEKSRGTGLGLSSVYGVVKRHSGYVEVQSPLGQGVSVDIYLPAAMNTSAESKESPAPSDNKQTKILLVDDEEAIIKLAERMLNRLGYTVLTATGGKEAIAIYEKMASDIDLVILDMIMPGMSGEETYRGLKAIDPAVTVLVSSGYSVESQAREILDEERNGFMQKPYDMQTLSAKVKEMLE